MHSYNNRRRLQTDTSSCSKRYTSRCHRKLNKIKPALEQFHSLVTHNKYSLHWTSRAQQWLLNIGSGNLPEISGLPCNSIEIPQEMVVEENLIEAIYSENLNAMEVEQLAKRSF
ncbi:hypothetical protein AVEN_148659-1 [Araneus ventricosus]|uniref:Uncharacterized protein n=1 Tax=Araneus ventricosus TaxID=182803 RepID=A0A4Y2TIL7_ARAVE|nr:hypothetical protein AVEN_148659-1 [Araneus ventricosus]